MATHPLGTSSAGSTPHWYPGSATYNRANLMAALRAGLIALVLLIVLVGLILI